MIIIPIMPKDELDGFEIKFSAITNKMAFYLAIVFNNISGKSLTPSDIAFDIYVTRNDNTPLIRLFACSVIQNIVTSERYCNIMVSNNKYVDLHGINFNPSNANFLPRNFTTVYLTSTAPSSTGKKFMFGGLQISTPGNFDPSMEESWGLECINIEILR
jgi:hypothetical protein